MDCFGMGMGDLCPGTLCCPATHEGNWFSYGAATGTIGRSDGERD